MLRCGLMRVDRNDCRNHCTAKSRRFPLSYAQSNNDLEIEGFDPSQFSFLHPERKGSPPSSRPVTLTSVDSYYTLAPN